MPILNEIKKRMVPEKTVKEKTKKTGSVIGRNRGVETLDSVHEDIMTEEGESCFESSDKKT